MMMFVWRSGSTPGGHTWNSQWRWGFRRGQAGGGECRGGGCQCWGLIGLMFDDVVADQYEVSSLTSSVWRSVRFNYKLHRQHNHRLPWSRAELSRRRGNGGGDGGELWNCLCRLWPYNLEVLLHFPRISGILCVKCEHGNVICRLLLVWLGVKCGFITSRKGFGHSYVSSFMCGNYISGSLTDKSRDIWLHKTHAFT